MLIVTRLSYGWLTVSGALNLARNALSVINPKVLTRGTTLVDGSSSGFATPSHLAMAPENLLCVVLSLALGIDAVTPLRKILPALAAISKFADLIFVAADCFTCNALNRAQLVPMRR